MKLIYYIVLLTLLIGIAEAQPYLFPYIPLYPTENTYHNDDDTSGIPDNTYDNVATALPEHDGPDTYTIDCEPLDKYPDLEVIYLSD